MKLHHRLLIVAGAALLVALSAALILSRVIPKRANEAESPSLTERPRALGEPGLLLVYSDQEPKRMLRPIDPASLADLPGYTPLELGVVEVYAVSPDGQYLAAIVKTSERPLGGALHLIDIPSWTHRPTGVTIETGVSHLSFDSEGKALYWISAGYNRLERYDLATQQRSVLATFPSWFSPWELRQLPSGSRIVVYGLQIATGGWPKGPPHVFIVDAKSRRILTNLSLGGIRAGSAGPPPQTADEVGPDNYGPGLGWDLSRGLLYIAHADQDKVTVADLNKGTVQREGEIRQPRSLLGGLADWLVPRAEAKLMPGTRRQAVVSPDGSRLYIAGSREEIFRGSDGRLQSRVSPLGLRVVATVDFTELGTIDLPVDHVELSPSGRRMVLSGFSFDTSSGENSWSGLHIADPVELTVLAHLKPDGFPWVAGFSPHGEYAYLGSDSRLAVLDLVSGRIAAERTGLGHLEALSFLPRGGS